MASAVRLSFRAAAVATSPAVILMRRIRFTSNFPTSIERDGTTASVGPHSYDAPRPAADLGDRLKRRVPGQGGEVVHLAQVDEAYEARPPSRGAGQRPRGVVVAQVPPRAENAILQEPRVRADVQESQVIVGFQDHQIGRREERVERLPRAS